jgi:hypothetical protein
LNSSGGGLRAVYQYASESLSRLASGTTPIITPTPTKAGPSKRTPALSLKGSSVKIKTYRSKMGPKGWDYSHYNLKKDTWYPVIQGGGAFNHYEISVCHSSEPHGFGSWGWSGDHKLIVSVRTDHYYPKGTKAFLVEQLKFLKHRAEQLAEALNNEGK